MSGGRGRGLRGFLWRARQKLARELGSPVDFLRVALSMAWRKLVGRRWPDTGNGPLLSVVTCVRNRAGKREENCLRSLTRQSLPRERYEIIVVDYGSDDPGKVAALAAKVDKDIRVVRVPERGAFNNPRAKNIGWALAKGGKAVFTNFDIVFAENALETIWLALAGHPKRFVEVRRFDLPEALIEGNDLVGAYGRAALLPGVKLNWTAADLQALDRREMADVFNGFDEAFEGWGAWDTDMRERAVNAGFRCLNLFPLTSLLHQGHASLDEVHGLNYRRNRDYLEAKPLDTVKANPGRLGAGR